LSGDGKKQGRDRGTGSHPFKKWTAAEVTIHQKLQDKEEKEHLNMTGVMIEEVAGQTKWESLSLWRRCHVVDSLCTNQMGEKKRGGGPWTIRGRKGRESGTGNRKKLLAISS